MWFKVTRAKQKMDGAIDELKLKLKSDNGQQSVDLYNREKNMIVGKDSPYPSHRFMTLVSRIK